MFSWYNSLSPSEFEILCLEVLRTMALAENLKDFNIVHNATVKGMDGDYQIDVLASFLIMNMNMTLVCECKKHSRPVTRDMVVNLFNRVRSIGAQKGVLISVNGFQTGARLYAKNNGIALFTLQMDPTPNFNGPSDLYESYRLHPPSQPASNYSLIQYLSQKIRVDVVTNLFSAEERAEIQHLQEFSGETDTPIQAEALS